MLIWIASGISQAKSKEASLSVCCVYWLSGFSTYLIANSEKVKREVQGGGEGAWGVESVNWRLVFLSAFFFSLKLEALAFAYIVPSILTRGPGPLGTALLFYVYAKKERRRNARDWVLTTYDVGRMGRLNISLSLFSCFCPATHHPPPIHPSTLQPPSLVKLPLFTTSQPRTRSHIAWEWRPFFHPKYIFDFLSLFVTRGNYYVTYNRHTKTKICTQYVARTEITTTN